MFLFLFKEKEEKKEFMKITIPENLQPLAEAFAKEKTEAYVVGGLVRNAL